MSVKFSIFRRDALSLELPCVRRSLGIGFGLLSCHFSSLQGSRRRTQENTEQGQRQLEGSMTPLEAWRRGNLCYTTDGWRNRIVDNIIGTYLIEQTNRYTVVSKSITHHTVTPSKYVAWTDWSLNRLTDLLKIS